MPPLPRRPLPTLSRLISQSRYSSSSASSTPKLAKPTKYNPPSHPTNLPRRDPVNYPGPPPIRDPETARYPNTMPPPGTWAYYFLTSRRLHFYLSLSILAVLGGFASFQNFLRTNPYAGEVYWKWTAPIGSIKSVITAWKKGVEEESGRVAAMRQKTVDDVEKRGMYRKAHGLEQTGEEGGFGGWGVKESPKVAPVAVDTASPTGGKGGWVEDELKKVEQEAEKTAATATTQAVGSSRMEEGQTAEPKKSSWKFW